MERLKVSDTHLLHHADAARTTTPIIWFEVEEILRHYDSSPIPTGIMRVCFEILAAAHKEFGDRVAFCRLSYFTGRFEPLSFHDVATRSSNRSIRKTGKRGRLAGARAAGAQLLHFLRKLSLTLWRDLAIVLKGEREFASRVAPGDTLVCLSKPDSHRHYCRSVASAKDRYGLKYGLLIHDVIPVTRPDLVQLRFDRLFNQWIKQVIPLCDVIFTASDFTRRELQGLIESRGWPLPPIKLARFGDGFSNHETAAVVASEPLPRRFVLLVSTIETRKNHRLLLHVWRRLIERHGAAEVPTLIFAGQIGWLVKPLLAELNETRFLDGKIIIRSGLNDAELAAAYRQCLFTVYPSIYEGWGLPVGESLAFGKFCLASNCTSLPEVGGSFAEYFDPNDVDDALAKIERALFEPGYVEERENRIRSEYKPATWTDCARAICEAE